VIEKLNIALLFNGEGHLNEEGVAFYAEKMLAQEMHQLPPQILQHVTDCQPCKIQCLEVFNILQQLEKERIKDYDGGERGSLGGSGPVKIPPEEKEPNMGSKALIFKIAAGILLIMGVGWVLMKGMRSMKDENSRLADNNTITDSKHTTGAMKSGSAIERWIETWEHLFPASQGIYHSNPSLESMLSIVFRSQDFIVVKPDSITEYKAGEDIIFDWSDKKGKEIELKIISRDGSLIHKRRLSHHSSYVVKKALPPGLYYWFIERSNVTVAGGRFGIIPDQ
jgi:hypothetical protein